MSTVTTDTKTKPTTFIAKCENLILVVEPRAASYNHLGIKIGVSAGKRVEFQEHEFTTDDAELIEWLRAQPGYNVPNNQGFYELGNAPDEPKPTVPQQQEAIEAATAAGDLDALEAVVTEEKATHNREVVLASAKIALTALAGKVTDKGDPPSPSTN